MASHDVEMVDVGGYDIDGDIQMDDTIKSPRSKPNQPTVLFGTPNMTVRQYVGLFGIPNTTVREHVGPFGNTRPSPLRPGEGLYPPSIGPIHCLPCEDEDVPLHTSTRPSSNTRSSSRRSQMAHNVAGSSPTATNPPATTTARPIPAPANRNSTAAAAAPQSATKTGRSSAASTRAPAATGSRQHGTAPSAGRRPRVSFALTEQQEKSQKEKERASHRLLDLNEGKLLGKICEHLPMSQLFTILSTSKAFQKAITKSEPCQRKMLLRKDPKLRPKACSPPNPLITYSIFLSSLAMQYGIVEGIHLVPGPREQLWEFRREYDIERPAPATHKCIDLTNRKASWRKMLVHRAELSGVYTSMMMLYRHKHQLAWNKFVQVRSHKGGFTLGEVLDAVEAGLEKYWEWRIAGKKLPKEFKDAVAKPVPATRFGYILRPL